MSRRPGLHSRPRRGLTLIELMIAVSITVVAGMALSTVMTATARTLFSTTNARSALQRAHAGYVRLRAYTDPARCLLQADERGFAIWLDDTTVNNVVNLREMRVVWFDTLNDLLVVERVKFPDEWPPELKASFDTPLNSGADFLFQMETQRALGYTATEVLADGIPSATIAHPSAAAQQARTFTLTMSVDDRSPVPAEVLTVHAFPNHAPPR